MMVGERMIREEDDVLWRCVCGGVVGWLVRE